MDKETARKIIAFMGQCSETINESIILVQQQCSDSECKAYRKACGKVLGEILCEVLVPIFDEHPDLKRDALNLEDESN